MRYLLVIIVILTFQSCDIAGSKEPERIMSFRSKLNTEVGILQGVRIDDQYFSSISLIEGKDTLLTFSDYGIRGREINFPVSMEDSDGYNIEIENSKSFVVWLSKRGGAASDGAFIKWNDSINAFTFSLAGPPQIIK